MDRHGLRPRDDKVELMEFTEDQWIATGYALAMTSVVWMRNVCHCEEDSMDDAEIHGDIKGEPGK